MRATGDGDDYTGRIIAGKYRVESLLGEGGMGKVYKATQLTLDKSVVLKLLRASLLSDTRTVARFQREAKAASRLNHPNSISILDFGQAEDGALFIAMEYVSGKDLHQVLASEGPLPEHRIVRIATQILSALNDAHTAGVIHRDLKPENIMVEQRRGEPDFVKVLDFGIAKIQESDGSEGQALTRAGFVCGTPEYMSPEQARGVQLDARSDLYAIGVICYQCATNMLPFEADSAVALATMHLTQEPVPPRKRRTDTHISEEMEQLILRAMAKDPNDRPQSAEEFRRELQRIGQRASEPTRVQAPIPQRASTRGARRMSQASTDRTDVRAPPPSRTETWASAPGKIRSDEELATVVADRKRVRARRERSTLTVFLTALGITAVVAGGGMYLWTQHAGSTEVVAIRADASEDALAPSAVKPEKRDPEKAQELTRKADAALDGGDYKRAYELYELANGANPTAESSKKLALVQLARGERESAREWLREYVRRSPDAKDVELIERHLRIAEKRGQC